MPKATAVWLVDNTSLTFEQIAEFCGLHELEVKGIADGDVAASIKGMDPIASGQLTREEIKKAESSPDIKLTIAKPKVEIPPVKTKRGPRYTPVSRRQDRPNAVLWLLKNHPEMKDAQIMRLVGTTKPTINAIRDRTHWNSANLQPADPVTLGLCTQIDLDAEVAKAAKRLEREARAAGKSIEKSETLLPATETTGGLVTAETVAAAEQKNETATAVSMGESESRADVEEQEAARMMEKLKEMGSDESDAGTDSDGDPTDGS